MVTWENTNIPKLLIDEIKNEYIKTVKKLQVNEIFKPIFYPKTLQVKPQESSITMA